MHLWIGSPGSGKSSAILAEVVTELRAGRSGFALLAPTADMAAQWRIRLTAQGVAVPASCITTLTEFIDPYARDMRPISAPAFHLLVGRILDELAPPSFAAVREQAGFRRALVAALQELFTAEARASRLEHLLSQGTLSGVIVADVVSVFAGVEAELRNQGQGLRSHRLEQAAQEIRRRGWRGGERLYLDGFSALTALELDVVDALTSRDIAVTITLPEIPIAAETRTALLDRGFVQRCFTPCRPIPQRTIAAAPTQPQEVTEIARRLLAAYEAGRPWRDMLVIVRQPGLYGPLLRSALARFDIPAAIRFTTPLLEQPPVRFFVRLMDALLHHWDHEHLLQALEMAASGYGGRLAGDLLLNHLRTGLPGRGFPAPDPLGLGPLAEWLSEPATPAEWSRRLRELSDKLIPRPIALPADASQAQRERERLGAREGLLQSLTATSELLPLDPIPLQRFWRAAETVLEASAPPPAAQPRDAVQVVTVLDAREREAPLVFVVGLLEGVFPAEPIPEPLLHDDVRATLAAHRIRIPTLADQQQEERWHLEVAFSRATEQLVLTYPQMKTSGEPYLPAFALASLEASRESTSAIRPKPFHPRAFPKAPVIYDEHLRDEMRARHLELSPTAIESFLQCRFQFFARHTLNLAGPQAAGVDRLDTRLQGTLIHRVIAHWHADPTADQETFFNEQFRQICDRHRIPLGFAAETIRLRLWRDLQRFFENATQPAGCEVHIESAFTLAVGDVLIRGQIDRCDVDAQNRAAVYDFKYSSKQSVQKRVDDDNQTRYVQGGLYLLAAHQQGWQPSSFHYYALRSLGPPIGWAEPEDIARLIRQSREAARTMIEEIHQGRIDVSPASPDACDYCDFADACRVRENRRVLAGGAGE